MEPIIHIDAEVHSYEPTPSDLVQVQKAALIFYSGRNLERWFEEILGHVQDGPSVILTEGIESIAISEGAYAHRHPMAGCLQSGHSCSQSFLF